MSASKRDILVRKTVDVLYREGFRATGMDKLVKETGVSKMTIYKHFKTKDDLILAALRLRDQEFFNSFVRTVEKKADTPRARLLAVFDTIAEWMEGQEFNSCIFIKAASEFQDPDHPANIASAEHKRTVKGYIQKLAEEAGAKNPEQLATQLFVLTEGEIVATFMLGNVGITRDTRSAAKVLIEAALI